MGLRADRLRAKDARDLSHVNNGFDSGGHRHVVLRRIVERIFAGADIPLAPRSDDLEAWVKRHDGQFKTYLIIPLASCAV